MSPAMAVFLMLCSFCFLPTYTTAAPTPVPTTLTPTAATTTVSCSSGKFIKKINLSAGSYVNGITSITCSDNIVMQISSGLTGTPYTATSGDGTYLSLGYCSYRSGISSSFVTQLKFIECTGGLDGTFGSTSATLTTGRCPTGQKAIGISFTQGPGFLTSFAFVCGTIARNVSCASGMFVTQITLRSSDVVYGISSITCSDGETKQVNTGLVGGAQSTASSTGGYCTYSTGLSGSFITQFTLGECTTSATDGPFGSNTATVTTHGCSSRQKAVGVQTTTGTALTSFSFACATIATAAPTPVPTQTPTVKPTATPTAAPTPAQTKGKCSCPNGTAALGWTPGCTMCQHCHTEFYLTSSRTCDRGGNFLCPSGQLVSAVSLKSGDGLNYLESFTCTDGSTKLVQVGNEAGGISHRISGPFISYSSGYYTGNTAATSGLYFSYDDSTDSATYGVSYASRTTKSCPAGMYLSGFSVMPIASNTFVSLGSTAICTAVSYLCPGGELVSAVYLRSGDGLNYFESFTCTDGSTVSVRVGNEAGGIADRISGPFISYSSGYYTGNTAATSGLYFTDDDSTDSATYGVSYASRTTKSCPAGMYLSGFSVMPIASNTLVSLGSTAICTAGGTCDCWNGVGVVGAVVSASSISWNNCSGCKSCYTGYALNPQYNDYCDPTSVYKCAAGAFITQLQMVGSLTAITYMTCSDGLVVSVHTSDTYANNSPSTATAGDGSSSSPGYCESSMMYTTLDAYQLKLTECTGGVIDGPFANYQPPYEISVKKTCGIGERAIGVEITMAQYDNDGEYFLQYFSIVCGTFNPAAPTPVPTQPGPTAVPTAAPTGPCSCVNGVSGGVGVAGCSTCESCNSGYALQPTTIPTCKPTTVVKCAAGAFITQVDGYAIVWAMKIASMKCSDGSTVSVNAGSAGGYTERQAPHFTATAGDGSSSSPGYCESSMVYDGSHASQLKLTECFGGVIDGRFGSNKPTTTAIPVTRTCGIGERAIGVETTTYPDRNNLYWLQYFSIVCGPIP